MQATLLMAALMILPVLSPASALFVDDPFVDLAEVPLNAPGAVPPALDTGAGPVPEDVRAPLLEAYRTSLLKPDVTAVLEARARTLGLPIAEIPWTHDVTGERPLADALAALAATDMPSMSRADLERAQTSGDALPRDLQVALAKLVWDILDAGQLQAEAFAPLSPAERRALGAMDDPVLFAAAVDKVDNGAVLGAARAVDQAVKAAEPTLRKWSLLLDARNSIAGRPLTPAGLAAGAGMLGDATVTTNWALGVAERPHTPASALDLPELPLSQALALFYVVNGIPLTEGAALGLILLDDAHPDVAKPLARAVVATTAAELVLTQNRGGADVSEFLRLDAEAARIAAADGATPADLELLERYALAARALADTPTLTAAELLLGASRDLAAAAPAAKRVNGPALVLPADTTRRSLPGGGSISIHNERNGTSFSVDANGDGTHEFWTPATAAVRHDFNQTQCSILVYRDLNNDGRVQETEKDLDVPSMCSVENDVTLQDPYGYFVVGGKGATHYGPDLGGIRSTVQNRKSDLSNAQTTYNGSIAGQIIEQFGQGFGLISGGSGNNPCSIQIFVCVPRFGNLNVQFTEDGFAEDVFFERARRSNMSINSQHYQVLTWDLGGDDRYTNNAGGTYNWSEPYTMQRIEMGDFAGVVALAVDEGGNDTYLGSRNYTVGSAQLGVGLLVDRAGNDTYTAPADALASSAGVRRYTPASDRPGVGTGKGSGNAPVTGDGVDDDVGPVRDPETEKGRGEEGGIVYTKFAGAFAAVVDLAGNDAYRSAERSLAFSNASVSFLLDLGGNDRYTSGEFSQGVANATWAAVRTRDNQVRSDPDDDADPQAGLPLVAVAALVDAKGNDTYATKGRDNTTQGRGLGHSVLVLGGAGMPIPTVGLLLDLDGSDTGIRRNGNVTAGPGLVEAGFRTRHVFRANQDPSQPDNRPDTGVSLALDLNLRAPKDTDVRPAGTVFAAPASHVDMDEDPFFALDLYVDLPRLFVLGAEANTTYEQDAVVLVDLGGRDVYRATVGAASFDWNSVTSHPGFMRGQVQTNPSQEGAHLPVAEFLIRCRDDDRVLRPCTVGTYETGRVAPVALALDLEGADSYILVHEKDAPVRGFGYGLAGVGALYDLGRFETGDRYNVSRMGLGAAEMFGAGILYDSDGDDDYRMVYGKVKGLPAESHGLGFAHTGGVAIAIDARRPGGSSDDRYNATNMSLGAILVDLRHEYAVFLDAGGRDTYVGGPHSIAAIEDPATRPESARFRGLFGWITDPSPGNTGSFTPSAVTTADAFYCYYMRYGGGDAQATFVDDGLDTDSYTPARTSSGVRRANDGEWRSTAWTTVAPADDDENCRGVSTQLTPPPQGQANPSPAVGKDAATVRTTSAGYALGVDNTDAYADRHAAEAMRDPWRTGHRETEVNHTRTEAGGSLTYLPLDEVFAARAILLAPAAIYVDANGNGLATSTSPVLSGENPVQVAVVKGASSVVTNTRAFAEFLVQDSVPRLTCSYVPPPMQPVRELGRDAETENEDATEGGRPDVNGAETVNDFGVQGISYRQYRRGSEAPGYCKNADAERKTTAENVADPCTVRDRDTRVPDYCATVDPNPVTDAALGALGRLDLPPSLGLPMASMQIPVLAEAFRLVAETDADLALHADDVEQALTDALARVLRGDVASAESILRGGITAPASGSSAANACNQKANSRAATDDCRDVGTVSFNVLRKGQESHLGSWDNRADASRAGDNVTVFATRADPNGVYYRHLWLTNATTSKHVAFPDGPYDLVVRSTYREDGNVGTGAANVPLQSRAPVSEEAIRRVHDEYGYYPGENWLNVTVNNPPVLLKGLSEPGHFRPGVDATKRVSLVFSEPVKASVRLERPGVVTPPVADQVSPHFPRAAGARECRDHAPSLVGAGDVLDFEIPVAGLGAGVYTMVVEARDRDPSRADCTRQAATRFTLGLVGDSVRPSADVDLGQDFLRNGSRVRCADGDKRECLNVTLVADRGLSDQSPIASWTVALDIVKPSGETIRVPAVTTEDDVYTVRREHVIHGATYRFHLSAVDAAGNAQAQPSVREILYDAYEPRVKDVLVPPTVRPDGVLVVKWDTESADPVFGSDVAGVHMEWATGLVPAQGASPTRIWRDVPARFVDAALGEARIPVADVLDDALPEDGDVAANWTRFHDGNLTDAHRFEVRLRAFDAHGNWEATDPWNESLVHKLADGSRFDTVAPNVTVLPEVKVAHDSATIEFELSEPGTAVVHYGLEGSDVALKAGTTPRGNGSVQSVSLPSLRQASAYAFRIVAKDLVGNERSFPPACGAAAPATCGNFTFSTERVVTVEITAPKAGVVASGQQRIEWSATEFKTDPFIFYQLKLSADGGKTFPYELTPATGKALYERSSPLRVFLFDTRDHPDTSEAVVRVLANNSLNKGVPLAFDSPVFRIDNAPPRTVAVLGGEGSNGWFRTPVDVSLVPADTANVSAVRSIEHSLDNVTFTSVEGEAAMRTVVTVATEGRHTVYFRAVDALGNAEPVRSVRFSIDLGLPEALLVLEGGEAASADRTVDLEVAAKDAQSGVASVVVRTTGLDPLVVPGERFRNGAFVQPFTFPEGDGERVVQVDVTDVAGNRVTVQQNVRVDSTPPAFEESVFDRVAFETATGSVRLTEPAALTVYVKRATDVGYQGRVDYAEPTTAHRVVLNGLVPSTEYVLRLVATDALGNKAETTYGFTTLEDLAPPTEPIALLVKDEGHGAVKVIWTPAADNVGIDHYVVLRAPADADDAAYAPVGVAYRPSYLDDDVVAGTRYSYRVHAVDTAGNAGPTSALAFGRASTVPTLGGGLVDPPAATAAETFTYTITYRDGDGDAPAFVRIYIDGEVHDMVKEKGAAGADAYREGVRYVYHATLEPTRLSTGVHTFRFEASDGNALVRFPVEGLEAAVGPAVFASPGVAVDGTSALGAAIRDVPGAGLLAALGAVAAVAVGLRRRWA